MPDLPGRGAQLFHGVRPSIVVDEGETANTFSVETLCEIAVPKVAKLDVHMSNVFEDKFISKYITGYNLISKPTISIES